MAFLEMIGKKLSDAGQSVAQQTRNLADVNQLNSAIADKDKHINQLISVLGRSYYERHKEDSNAENWDIIQEINLLYIEISQNRDRIRQIKGLARCENCGADVPVNAAFCNGCGAKLEQPAAVQAEDPNQSRCPTCGAAVGRTDRFCTKCGTRLDE